LRFLLSELIPSLPDEVVETGEILDEILGPVIDLAFVVEHALVPDFDPVVDLDPVLELDPVVFAVVVDN